LHTSAIALVLIGKAIHCQWNTGVNGYLAKGSSKEEVIEAIRAVGNGNTYYSQSISTKLFNSIANSKTSRKKKEIHFTPQEKKIIQLICKQQTNKEIASNLNLCTRTVEDYRNHIQEKTGAKNVVGIVLYAILHEIVLITELN
jgi:DNA-binding NarL/FixJ family response regulator